MTHEVYTIDDLLTLMVAAQQYPDGFVGVGTKIGPTIYLCTKSVPDNMSMFSGLMKLPRAAMFLCPTADAACAVHWEQADPVCYVCKKSVRDH